MGNRGIGVVAVVGAVFACLFLAAIIVPGLFRTCACGTEARVISQLHAVNSAQFAYAARCGDTGYAYTPEELMRAPVTGGDPFAGPGLITVREWVITMRIPAGAELQGASCNGSRRARAYFVEARPEKDLGSRFFATDERGMIYQSDKPIREGMAGARLLQ